MAYADEVLADTPKAYWKLQELSGLPQDSSGNGLHMTSTVGTPIYRQNGPMGTDLAIRYPVANTSHRRTPAVSTSVGDVAAEAWIYLYLLSGTTDFVKQADSPVGGLLCRVTSTPAWIFVATGDGSGTYSTVPTLGSWFHVVMTRESGVWKIYINAVGQTFSPGTATAITGTYTQAGNDLGGADIVLSHVAFYEHALSAARVAAHFAAAPARQIAPAALFPQAGEVRTIPQAAFGVASGGALFPMAGRFGAKPQLFFPSPTVFLYPQALPLLIAPAWHQVSASSSSGRGVRITIF